MAKKKKKGKAPVAVADVEVLPAEASSPSAVKAVQEIDPSGDPAGDIEVLPPSEVVDTKDWEVDQDLSLDEGEDSTSVVPYDPLIAYLREIRRYPALTREEEHALAVRYRENKDIESAYKLVKSNLWLVVKIARDYERAARNLLDLIQEGNIGLMEAVKNFDPYRGVRFPSYAGWWIKAYIVRFIIANWRLVKLGTTQAQRKLFFNLKKEKDKLEKEGFWPGPKLLAEKLNVRESDVVEMEQRMGAADLSVDAPLQHDSDANLHSLLQSRELSAEELLSQKQARALLAKTLQEFSGTLNEKEIVIYEQRLLGEEKATLQDLADKLSLSKERIRQIESRLKDKLKEYLMERLGSAVDNPDFL